MIKTHKEPQGLSGAQLEHCVFCKTPTEYWDKSATFPVCDHCSNVRDETDLDAKRKLTMTTTLCPSTLGMYLNCNVVVTHRNNEIHRLVSVSVLGSNCGRTL